MSRRQKRTVLSGDRRRQRQRTTASKRFNPTNVTRDGGGVLATHITADVIGRNRWLIMAALVVAVFLAYQPAWNGRFVWDDDLHLVNNPVLLSGHFLETWVPGVYVNYWPLTFTVYRLEFEIWGLNPLGFHLVNIGLHAISAMLVWRILEHLRIPGSMLAAAIFALHPVNVESVAWITQLKNTLSLTLTLLSVLFYLGYDLDGGWWRFLLAVAMFLLSALAKGMALTLPVVLLACVWWQHGRIGRRDLLQMFPFLLIAALMVGIELSMQHEVAGGTPVRSDSLLSRTAIAGCAVWFYFGKFLWPTNLIFVYPRWNIDERDILSYLPGMLLVAILVLGWWRRHSWGRSVVMLTVCYVALLLPVLGFVNIYFMEYSLVADHWQYAAIIVPCAASAGAVTRFGRRLPQYGPAYLLCFGLLAALAVLTFRQSRMYTDIETLFQVTVNRNPSCWMAHNNLGLALANRGDVDRAIEHYEKALQIKSDDAPAHYNLGALLRDAAKSMRLSLNVRRP